MNLIDVLFTVAGVPPLAQGSIEERQGDPNGDGWYAVVSGHSDMKLAASTWQEARAEAEVYWHTRGWKRFTRWDPDNGTSTCYLVL